MCTLKGVYVLYLAWSLALLYKGKLLPLYFCLCITHLGEEGKRRIGDQGNGPKRGER